MAQHTAVARLWYDGANQPPDPASASPPGKDASTRFLPRSSFKHLFAFTNCAHIHLLLCALGTACVVAAGKTLYAIVLGNIFNVVAQWGANSIQADELVRQLARWCLWLVVLGIGVWCFAGTDAALWIVLGEMQAREARRAILRALCGKTMGWFDGKEGGLAGLMVGVQSQTLQLQLGSSQTLGFLAADSLVFLACLIVALYYSAKLTLVMLSTAVPSAIILGLLARFLDPAIERQKVEFCQASKHVSAALTAIDLVKVYNGEDHEAYAYSQAVTRAAQHYLRQAVCNCGQMAYVKLWMVMLFVLGFYYALLLVDGGGLTAGDAVTTFYATLTAFNAMEQLGPHWMTLVKGMSAGQTLAALAGKGDDDGDETENQGGYRPRECVGDIELKGVCFAYPSNPTKLVLQPCSFFFPAGDITFLVGRSGSGKSTLGNLLLRFYEPLRGHITLDRNPIKQLDLEWLRGNVTFIQQASTLFHTTMHENVAFGARDPDKVSKEDVQAACAMAMLQSTIADMPQGLDTLVGYGGHGLSGGQVQRLALARAKLRDPPVLILDEVTSGLDPASRTLIMEAVRLWRKGKTTVVITHDVAQIAEQEYVYVMEEGRVVQEGFGKELAHQGGGLFAQLVASGGDAQESGDSKESISNMAAEAEAEAQAEAHEAHDVAQSSEISPLAPTTAYRLITSIPSRLGREASNGPRPHGLFASQRATIRTSMMRSQPMWDSPCRAPDDSSTGSCHQSLRQGDSSGVSGHSVPIGKPARVAQRKHQNGIDFLAETDRAVREVRDRQTNGRHQRQDARFSSSSTRRTSKACSERTLDSLEGFFPERLAGGDKSKQRLGTEKGTRIRKEFRSKDPVPSVCAILRTVWPTLDRRARTCLIFGLIACAVAAGSSPVFSVFLVRLIQTFWLPTSRSAAGSFWASRLLVVAFVDASATFASFFLMELTGSAWVDRLRNEAFRRVLSQPRQWFDMSGQSAARITGSLEREAEEMRRVVSAFIPTVVIVTGTMSAALVWALVVRWDMTLVTLCGIPVAVAITRANAVVSTEWDAVCVAAAEKAGSVAVEVVMNMGVVRALTLQKYFIRKHDDATETAYSFGRQRARRVGLWYGAGQAIPFFVTALVFSYGARLLANRAANAALSDVFQVINLLLFSLGTSTTMLANLPQLATAKTAAVHMLFYARLSHDAGHEAQGTIRLRRTPLPVRLRGLRFAYPSRPDVQVLRTVDMDIAAGSFVVIAGESGCGKSTLASLLLKLYEPGSSTPSSDDIPPLSFADMPANSLLTTSLRHHIGYVPQQPFLFPGTLAENILYGLHESSPLRSQRNLSTAARLAGLEDLVASLPQGLHTTVGDGGLSLSGGQAQRVGIARALARWPKLLVMDEPTSALDARAAADVRAVLKRLLEVRQRRQLEKREDRMAVVVVTHSKEMMRMADRIVVLKGGRVVEEGEYERLVEMDRIFAELVGGGAWAGGAHGRKFRTVSYHEA